jgi:hypothetical protein
MAGYGILWLKSLALGIQIKKKSLLALLCRHLFLSELINMKKLCSARLFHTKKESNY